MVKNLGLGIWVNIDSAGIEQMFKKFGDEENCSVDNVWFCNGGFFFNITISFNATFFVKQPSVVKHGVDGSDFISFF